VIQRRPLESLALVTGGAGAIGQATARRLLNDGYRVAICSRAEVGVARALSELSAGEDVIGVVGDLAQEDEARRVVDEAAARLGGLSVLINAHGIQGRMAPVAELDASDWMESLRTNLLGPISTSTAAIAHMTAGGGGSIVNVASIDGLRAEPGVAAYGVAKAALIAFTRYAAAELADVGIRVNAVAPGWVRTPMTEEIIRRAGADRGTWANNALGRPAEPDELASVITFLASPLASYVTGETLVADGGQVVLMRELALRSQPSAR
jgi:meso-butanediol dehydrogenase / (S,S)-butanediol dehydrogenase / diacetyl reductase